MRRGAPEVIVGLLLVVLLASYVVYTQRVVRELRVEAQRSSLMYARVLRAQADTSADAGTEALFDLTKSIIGQGVPIVVTDPSGRPTYHANLPLDTTADESAQLRRFVRELDRQNTPVSDSLVGQLHFGNTPLVKWLRIIPALQALSAVILLAAGIYIVRTRGNAERERVWAGMARESAHQLGTPLSSLAGWIELLEDRAHDDGTRKAVGHMRADLERLDAIIKDRSLSPVEARIAARKLKIAPPFSEAVIVLNPKIDTKGQRRLQCSLRYADVLKHLAPGTSPEPEESPALWGVPFPGPVVSAPRN